MGFPNGPAGTESACQRTRCKGREFGPWVRKTAWRRKWQPAPASLPGKFYGQRSLAGCRSWGLKESDTTECVHTYFIHTHTHRHTHVRTHTYLETETLSNKNYIAN